MNLAAAKKQLDKVINKSRVHLYKPIQVAEILYRDRVHQDIQLENLETYKNSSKEWRDIICRRFLHRISNSSASYQNNVFNDNATPPAVLKILAIENRRTNGGIEAYIYKSFLKKQSQMIQALNYVSQLEGEFKLTDFLDRFRRDQGLKRSVDKIYEIVVYALFSVMIKELEASITISIPKEGKLDGFCESIFGNMEPSANIPVKIYRAGITNAADRGLDMWANFGPAIQIKHCPLTKKIAQAIIEPINADRVIIVCKNVSQTALTSIYADQKLKSKIQCLLTEKDLANWYKKVAHEYPQSLSDAVIATIQAQLKAEFPTSDQDDFQQFIKSRNYEMNGPDWSPL